MTMPNPDAVRAAAYNNARWCAAMSRSHGVEGEFGPQAWTAPRRTPLYYPDAVTLTPHADASALIARIDTTAPGATVKDSFADLDLTRHGFTVLFDAQWIHRPAGPPTREPESAWDAMRDPAALRTWALACCAGDEDDAHLFRPGLLAEPEVLLVAGRDARGSVVAGAVASPGDGVIGISNVFAKSGDLTAAWPVVLDAAHALFPDVPLVGYEHGDALTAACAQGFTPIGPLRVWLRR
ncbi:hypothetical protein OKJ48_36545 [Streptomyces kunmingensis]|uniref:GNAT family N-acetyltransferase n=1 Tax=Streptomyces kunmingensis TaxID=68225 RepID=A0ABU6CLV5_9ACTN|nr:hypothetical protein [Streptomyces kunmingensis]MEB3965693.1 hypothetical protein [Streptomyces kunmingensis]